MGLRFTPWQPCSVATRWYCSSGECVLLTLGARRTLQALHSPLFHLVGVWVTCAVELAVRSEVTAASICHPTHSGSGGTDKVGRVKWERWGHLSQPRADKEEWLPSSSWATHCFSGSWQQRWVQGGQVCRQPGRWHFKEPFCRAHTRDSSVP